MKKLPKEFPLFNLSAWLSVNACVFLKSMIKIQIPNATQAQQAYAHAHVVAHAQQQAAQQAREHRERQVRPNLKYLENKNDFQQDVNLKNVGNNFLYILSFHAPLRFSSSFRDFKLEKDIRKTIFFRA